MPPATQSAPSIGGATRLRQAVFVEQRRSGWQRLEQLLDAAERRGLSGLAPEDVDELGVLYRWVTSDLAFATGRGYDAGLQAYLNRLTARAHAVVYAGAAEGGWERVFTFFRTTFPAEVYRSRGVILLSALIFVAAALLAHYLIRQQPLDAYVLLPAQFLEPIHKGLHETNFVSAQRGLGAPALSALIMQNNIRLAFYAFAGGLTLGIVTVYLLGFNGLVLGGLAALYESAGFGRDFWATIAPHGIIELTAVQIASGAGLLLAASIIAPGRLQRRDALRRNAARAGVLIIGVTSMLAVAGFIEGFISPDNFSPSFRLAFGAATAVGMAAYFSGGWRRAIVAGQTRVAR